MIRPGARAVGNVVLTSLGGGTYAGLNTTGRFALYSLLGAKIATGEISSQGTFSIPRNIHDRIFFMQTETMGWVKVIRLE